MDENPISKLVGSWKGTARTWLKPESDPTTNDISATFRPLFDGPSLICEYTSMVGEHPSDGVMLIGKSISDGRLSMSWCDTFHTTSDVMVLAQDGESEGLTFRGTYTAGKETWGWRIAFSVENDSLRIAHFNVMPPGKEMRAVEIACERAGA